MTVAYFEEPRRGRRADVCSVCGEPGHRGNNPRHRGQWKAKPLAPLTSEERRAAALVILDDNARPQTRGDCANVPRPCPYVSCSQHLYLDVNPDTGAIKINFPAKEPWELAETCALDVADRGGAVLEEVGALTGLTRERIRQIEERTIRKIRTVAPELAEACADPLQLPPVDDRLGRR